MEIFTFVFLLFGNSKGDLLIANFQEIGIRLTANKSTLNVKKTKYMLIGNKFKLSQIHADFTVKVHNTPLDRVNKHKYLGVYIDETLNWRPHINAT